jgi:general secretion pathway protein G
MHKRGFTLLELLVVISVIALLAGFLGVVIGNVMGKAELKKTEATVQAISSALQNYFTEWNNYYWAGRDVADTAAEAITYLEERVAIDIQGVSHGPYITEPLPKDPGGTHYVDAWGQLIRIRFPGADHSTDKTRGPDLSGATLIPGNINLVTAKPEIYSIGPNGVDDTFQNSTGAHWHDNLDHEDDILNWKLSR